MVRHGVVGEISSRGKIEYHRTNDLVILKVPNLQVGEVYEVVDNDSEQLTLRKLSKIQIINTQQVVLPDSILIDFSTHSVSKQGIKIDITKTMWKVLQCLAENNGRAVSLQTICEEVWDYYTFREPHILRVQIYRLRQALGFNSIETIAGYGYRLCQK